MKLSRSGVFKGFSKSVVRFSRLLPILAGYDLIHHKLRQRQQSEVEGAVANGWLICMLKAGIELGCCIGTRYKNLLIGVDFSDVLGRSSQGTRQG